MIQLIKKISKLSFGGFKKIGNEGALERHFRPEKNGEAIPIESSNLRLYCLRLSDENVILVNGGIKTSQTAQDSPDLLPHFETINSFKIILRWKIRSGLTQIAGKKILGDLSFFINN